MDNVSMCPFDWGELSIVRDTTPSYVCKLLMGGAQRLAEVVKVTSIGNTSVWY